MTTFVSYPYRCIVSYIDTYDGRVMLSPSMSVGERYLPVLGYEYSAFGCITAFIGVRMNTTDGQTIHE
jgi:hypothetical protein